MTSRSMKTFKVGSILRMHKKFSPSVAQRRKRKVPKPVVGGNYRFTPVRYAATDMDGIDGIMNRNTHLEEYTTQGLLVNCGGRVFAFKSKPSKPAYYDFSPVKKKRNATKANITTTASSTTTSHRNIPKKPTLLLDAPDIANDYYLNLLSWGPNNLLAVALGHVVYLWNCTTGSTKELMSLPEDSGDAIITCVAWMTGQGSNEDHIAVATSQNSVQLWDAARISQVRSMTGHTARVGSLAWNRSILTSGSQDTTVVNHDVRVNNHRIATMRGHSQEVCGLAWSPDGRSLASGSNDNTVCMWDSALSRSRLRPGAAASAHALSPRVRLLGHTAAVKAVAWSPHERNVLATGGGIGDNSIKLWRPNGINSTSAPPLKSVDTGSQVSSMVWNPHRNELLSGHGYAENQLTLWSNTTTTASLTRMVDLKGHTDRVLSLAVSPDGSSVVSAGGDEKLRFWNVFGEEGGSANGEPPYKKQKRSGTARTRQKVQGSRLLGGGDEVRYRRVPREEMGYSLMDDRGLSLR